MLPRAVIRPSFIRCFARVGAPTCRWTAARSARSSRPNAAAAAPIVLCVGEGNFSGALALVEACGRRARVIATSFDSRRAVLATYPEARTKPKQNPIK